MKYKVGYVYLKKQFARSQKYFSVIKKVIQEGDFTLGKKVIEFENNFANKFGVKHAIGVGSGTDALFLTIKALGIGSGDEVITAPNSFVASASVIALTGARPVFVDVRDDYTINPALIEKAITKKTKAIIPVHLTGFPADMYDIGAIAKKHNLYVIEDAAQGSGTLYDGKFVGSFGIAAGFSMHPLKILHVWGDGGIITTNNDNLAGTLRLWRNHGLRDREDVAFFAHNSKLDTVHAAVANEMLKTLDWVINKRIKIAAVYTKELVGLEPYVHVPKSLCGHPTRPIYTTQVIQVHNRDQLMQFLLEKKIESVVQYRTPIHFKKAAQYLGYKKGDFPVCEQQAETILTIPNHQYMRVRDVYYVTNAIKQFYTKAKD